MSDFSDQLLPTAAQAEAAAAALVDGVFRPLLAEFRAVMESEGVLCRGRIRQERPALHRPDAGTQRLIYAARGTAAGQRLYEVRLAARVGRLAADLSHTAASELPLELTAECVHDGPPGFRPQPSRQPLAELPRKTLRATAIDRESARQWCEEVLKQSAEALMEANFCPLPACVHAPLAAVPAVDPGGVFST